MWCRWGDQKQVSESMCWIFNESSYERFAWFPCWNKYSIWTCSVYWLACMSLVSTSLDVKGCAQSHTPASCFNHMSWGRYCPLLRPETAYQKQVSFPLTAVTMLKLDFYEQIQSLLMVPSSIIGWTCMDKWFPFWFAANGEFVSIPGSALAFQLM